MAASIRTIETLTGKPGEFALENRRFCTRLIAPSPSQFMVQSHSGFVGSGLAALDDSIRLTLDAWRHAAGAAAPREAAGRR
jgi:hypothetical protein